LISDNSRREIEADSQILVNQIVEWCKSAKLQISERKSEAGSFRSSLLRSKEERKSIDREKYAKIKG